MGEMAEMMLDGTLDQNGEYIDGDSPGYPRYTGEFNPTKRKNFKAKGQKAVNGVSNYLLEKKPNMTAPEMGGIIAEYCKDCNRSFDTIVGQARLEAEAEYIQSDFGAFVKWWKNR